jgi:hypothetical protein
MRTIQNHFAQPPLIFGALIAIGISILLPVQAPCSIHAYRERIPGSGGGEWQNLRHRRGTIAIAGGGGAGLSGVLNILEQYSPPVTVLTFIKKLTHKTYFNETSKVFRVKA